MSHPVFLTAVIYLAGLGAAGQFSKLAVSFAALSESYGGQETLLGLAVSLISLVGVGLGLFAGILVSRIGPRRAMIAALGIGAAISLWQATLPSLPMLMASRVIEGLAHLLIVVAAPTLLAERIASRHHAAALTLWSTFFGVAFALTAVAAPPLIDRGGLAAVLIGHSFWMALACVAAILVLPASNRPPPETARPSILKRHVAAYANPAIATPALAWLCYTLTFVSILTALPLLIQDTAPVWLAGVAPLVSITVALSIGIPLLRRFPARRIVISGFALCLVATGLTLWAGFGTGTILALFAAMALIQSAGFAIVPQLNPDAQSRALANGALAQMGNLGNLLGTPILIALHQGMPLIGPIAFLTLAYGAGLCLVVVLGRRAQAALT